MDDDIVIPPATPPLARTSKKVERSCILCHRRKVRCDKRSPCANCVRTGVLCCYPTPERSGRRSRKTTISDVAERLGRLERTLVAISSTGDSPQQVSGGDPGRSTPASPDAMLASASEEGAGGVTAVGKLVLQDDGDTSGHYINEVIFSHILDEEQELQSALGVVGSPASGPDAPLEGVDNLLTTLSGSVPSPRDPRDLLPSKWQAVLLWQAFQQYVSPFNRAIHVPTAQTIMFRAIENPQGASWENLCLVFSICFGGLVTHTVEDAPVRLGLQRHSCLIAFKQGLFRSLALSNFLEHPTVLTLQALQLFLQTIRIHQHGRSTWIITGLVMRAALSIGLHRDGKHLRLPPFETELRRRLWWYLKCHDQRSAEDHGISFPAYADFGTAATELPRNVEDAQLYPGMLELPPSQPRWTDMSLLLAFSEMFITSAKLSAMLPQSASYTGTANDPPSEAARRDTIDALRAHVNRLFAGYDPAVPLQRATALTAGLLVDKLDLVSRLQWATASGAPLTADAVLLERACSILEASGRRWADGLLHGYRWIASNYPQYHALLYTLWHLCGEPTGGLPDHAWELAQEAMDAKKAALWGLGPWMNFGARKWTVLARLRDRVATLRGEAGNWAAGGDETVDEGKPPGDGLWQTAGAAGNGSAEAEGFNEGKACWMVNNAEPPDWNTLVCDLGMDGEEFGGGGVFFE